MRKHLSILLLSLFSLTGCEKESPLMNSLKGDWYINEFYFKFTALADFVYADLYNCPWRGTVSVNGQPPSICLNSYSSSGTKRFTINREIVFEGNLVYYKNKYYEADFSFDQLDNGLFKCDFTIIHDGVPVNINVNLASPKIEMKSGETYKLRDYRFEGDPFAVFHFNIDSPKSFYIKESTGAAINFFYGKWSIENGRLNMSYCIDPEEEQITRSFNYIVSDKELLLFNKVDYNRNHIYGSIPEDKITGLYYFNSFARSGKTG